LSTLDSRWETTPYGSLWVKLRFACHLNASRNPTISIILGIREPIVALQAVFLTHFFRYVQAKHRKMLLVPPASILNVDNARGANEGAKKAFALSSP